MIQKYQDPPRDTSFAGLVHAFLVLRPREIVLVQSSETEMLETITERIIKLPAIIKKHFDDAVADIRAEIHQKAD